jgi:hypothetical protein
MTRREHTPRSARVPTLVLALALAGASAAHVGATGVVAFRTADRVVLGADSALTGFDAAGRVVSETSGCKVGRAGSWAFIWGGHRAGGTDTDLVATFTRAIAGTGTLDALTQAVRQFIARRIVTLDWPGLRATYPDAGDVVFWAGVGRVHDGTPELGIYRAAIQAYAPLALDLAMATCPGNCPAGWLAAGIAAERGPIAEALAHTPYPAWLAPLDGQAAYRLLAAQAHATPARIRAPFDVLAITVHGAHWIDRSPDSTCPAVLGERQ